MSVDRILLQYRIHLHHLFKIDLLFFKQLDIALLQYCLKVASTVPVLKIRPALARLEPLIETKKHLHYHIK